MLLYSVQYQQRNKLSLQLMPADLVQLTGSVLLNIFANVALCIQLLVLYFKNSDYLINAVVSAYKIIVIPYKEVRAECYVFKYLHFPIPAQDASRVNFLYISYLIRLALYLTRQRFIPIISLITFLNQSNVLEQEVQRFQCKGVIALRSFIRQAIR